MVVEVTEGDVEEVEDALVDVGETLIQKMSVKLCLYRAAQRGLRNYHFSL